MTQQPKVKCPWCGRMVALWSHGQMSYHSRGACPGSGRKPSDHPDARPICAETDPEEGG